MLPKWHTLLGFLFAYIIYWFTTITIFQAVLIFFASVFIDFDHYLYYVIIKRRFSLKSAYNWFKIRRDKFKKLSFKERKKHKKCILIFHGIEPIIILFLFAKIFPILNYMALGVVIHLIADLIIDYKIGVIDPKLSVIYTVYDYILKRKLKHII